VLVARDPDNEDRRIPAGARESGSASYSSRDEKRETIARCDSYQ
jgi:hypothetical protein